MIKLLIADDHQIFIDGLKALLKGDSRFLVVAEALNGEEIISLLKTIDVDIIIMDVSMPKMDGILATKIISTEYPSIFVLVLTMYNQKEFIFQLLKAGAAGYLLKNCSKEELTTALLTIASGNTYYSHEVTNTVFEGLKTIKRDESEQRIALSKREMDVLKLIAMELTTKEVAKKLFISESTVETHRKNLFVKLGVKNVAGLLRFAYEKHYLG